MQLADVMMNRSHVVYQNKLVTSHFLWSGKLTCSSPIRINICMYIFANTTPGSGSRWAVYYRCDQNEMDLALSSQRNNDEVYPSCKLLRA